MLMLPKLMYARQARGLVSRLCTQAAVCQQISKPVQEIVIPVPWGHIAGKWWGRTDIQPILGLHGWEDNANTFDTLVPHLDIESLLAVDFVGHGKSSHLPVGRIYNYLDFVTTVLLVQHHYKWQKLSILGHSLGSTIGFMYAGFYPDAIDRLVSIECAHSLFIANKIPELGRIKLTIDKSLAVEKKLGKEAPAYEFEEMVQILHEGTQHTISLEACRTLLQRGTCKVVRDGKVSYHFSRDPRVRIEWLGRWCEDICQATMARVSCKVLCIRARQGPLFCGGDRQRVYEHTINVLKNSASQFEYHEVDGSHHVHLNAPHLVGPIINKFLGKT